MCRTRPALEQEPTLDADLLDLLRLANPWLSEPGSFEPSVRARLPQRLLAHEPVGASRWPVAGKAHLLVGARQTGKTTWLWRRLLAERTPPIFVNAEEPLVRRWAHSPTRVGADLRDLARPGTPVLIDEAQHLEEAGLLVKGLVDASLPNPLYVTGSSAFHLRSRTRESLAGRAVRAEMHPLSLAELRGTLAPDTPRLLAESELDALALRHAVIGGYPEAWLSDRPELVLRGLVESFVLRDASDLFEVRNLDALRRVMELTARHCGDLLNLSEWASVVGVGRDTVAHYLDLLEEARIVAVVRPFAGGRRAELTGRPKVFLRDSGIRNAVLSAHGALSERPDRGPTLETWVAGELLKTIPSLDPSQQLHFWRSRSGAEVDFVVRRQDTLEGWEIKASRLGRAKLTRSARSFVEAYAPRRFTVVNLALDAVQAVGETTVRWVTPRALADLAPASSTS